MSKKSVLERSFEAVGVKPISRITVDGNDILIGDGFVTAPHVKLKKFGVDKGDFPNGCYATVWLWAGGEDQVDIGLPLFFHPTHDITQSIPTRQTLRVNAAIKSARQAIKAMKEVRRDA